MNISNCIKVCNLCHFFLLCRSNVNKYSQEKTPQRQILAQELHFIQKKTRQLWTSQIPTTRTSNTLKEFSWKYTLPYATNGELYTNI